MSADRTNTSNLRVTFGVSTAPPSAAVTPKAQIAPLPCTTAWTVQTLAQLRRWQWLWHWEFWLTLLVGALPRLWDLGFAQILGDQVGYLSLARESVLRGAFPVNGLEFTVGIRSNPLDILLTIPFVIASKDPFLDELAIALFNVLGIALCYIFAQREFGRRVALIGTLLLATCGFAVDYSRYLWQLSYQPPLLALYGLTLYAGGIRGQRGWLAPNIVLIALLFFLHPTAILLAPVTLAAVLLGPHRPRLREYVWATAVCGVLLLPSLLWEIVSGGYDIHHLLLFTGAGHAVINRDVFHEIYLILGPPTDAYIGHGVAYAAVTSSAPYRLLGGIEGINVWMRRGVDILYPVSWLVLTGLVLAPIQATWRAADPVAGWWRRPRAAFASTWRGLRASTTWRKNVLLWVWVTIPPASMIRHSSPVHGHYLLIIYPAIFIMLAAALVWSIQTVPTIARGVAEALGGHGETLARIAGQVALCVGLAFFLAGQAAQCLLYLDSAVLGDVDITGFGHPLGDVQAADASLKALQRQRGATAVYVSNPDSYFQTGLNYLLVREEPDRIGFYGACLILPPPQDGTALVVLTTARSPATALLQTLPDATHITDVRMNSGGSFPVYEVRGQLPLLPGEAPIGPVTYTDAAGDGLRLEAAAVVTPGVLRLRWTVLSSTPMQHLPLIYHVEANARTTGGAGAVLADAECAPNRWQAGQTLFTWLVPPTLPNTETPLPGTQSTWLQDQVSIQVQAHTTDFGEFTIGPMRLLSGLPVTSHPVPLTPASDGGEEAGLGTLPQSRQLVLPLDSLSLSPLAPSAGASATCLGMDSCYSG